MDDVTAPPLLLGNAVTAEDAAPWFAGDDARAREVAGFCASPPGVPFEVLTACGEWHPVPEGYFVIRYGPGDVGVLSPGAYRRFFGGTA